ncbi:hypothetical protein DVH05_000301 [Phytophthora capsici]|nr:hypothetical protein DVH05_000301 [Phytophthora capsici]
MLRTEDIAATSTKSSDVVSSSDEDDDVTPMQTDATADTEVRSHHQRLEKVKRIRDGASKAKRNSKKLNKGKNDKALHGLLKTAKLYFDFKLRQEMGAANTMGRMDSSDDDESENFTDAVLYEARV